MLFSTLTVSSMCRSMPPLRSARAAQDRRGRSATGRSSRRRASSPICSSAVPARLVEHRGRRADRPHADLEVDAELVGAGPHLLEVVGLERAEEANLAEVDDLDLPLGREVELLERRPVLRAEAEHVDAEADRCRPAARRRRCQGQRRRAKRLQEGTAIGSGEEWATDRTSFTAFSSGSADYPRAGAMSKMSRCVRRVRLRADGATCSNYPSPNGGVIVWSGPSRSEKRVRMCQLTARLRRLYPHPPRNSS